MSASVNVDKMVDAFKDDSLQKKLRVLKEEQIPVMVYGPPGVGKSSMISLVGKEDDFYYEGRPSQWDPVDARGLPFLQSVLGPDGKPTGEKQVDWGRPDFLPARGFDGTVTLYFDELNTAPPAVQNVLLQPFQAAPGEKRRVGPHEIDGSRVWLVAAGNREEDVAHVTPLSGPLRNRFYSMTLEANLRQWTDWAMGHDIHPHVIGFLNFRSEYLYQPPTDDEYSGFPTPRSWSEQVSPMIKRGLAGLHVFEGSVGKGAASEMMAYLKELRHMPNIDKLLAGTETYDIRTAPLSIAYALMVEFGLRCQKNHKLIAPAMDIARTARPEQTAVFVASLLRAEDHALRVATVAVPEMRKWASEHHMLIRSNR